MNSIVDLRSDTVTRPSAEMRRAMLEADTGDDVYGEDPTVNHLEHRAAQFFGKEDALFVPSGTMGNTIGVKIHTRHGQEVICDARSHVVDYELSMMAWFSGCIARTVRTPDGILHWEQIRGAVRDAGFHHAPTTLIAIENTHNMAGGTVYPIAVVDEICGEAHALGIKVHMDGARVFNAACALGQPVGRIAASVDTLMFCLSKGLGAPVGSMLVGSAADMASGRLYRKRLGGGMRQAGVLAAAGLIALEEMPSRLHEDHANAQFLAAELTGVAGIAIDAACVQTNIVIFDVSGAGLTASEFSGRLRTRGILANGISATHMRMVTHCDVNRDDCARAIEAVRSILQ